jgi:quercetin dioxygenase-like cupin family protein
MTRVRRVVTGHDRDGRAIVSIDDTPPGTPSRPGVTYWVAWTSEGFPVDNTVPGDQARRPIATTLPNGTVFRIVEFGPGSQRLVHRTESLDYAIVLSGEIDMELDDSVVHLQAGDVLVQRGTVHNWVNEGTDACVIAFILIDAKPVEAGGKVLSTEGVARTPGGAH